MPKKTRKQKIAAELRRQTQLTVPKQHQPITVHTPQKPIESSKVHVSSLDKDDTSVRHYFIKDLRKSFFLIGGILVLEFFFYFATIGNYLSKYLKF